MRLHTDVISGAHLFGAAYLARVDLDYTRHGSRSRDHAFNVKLTGESKRRPNGGSYGAGDDYAATWDQWGVFFGCLFRVDPDMACYAYENAEDFRRKTFGRFDEAGFPEDYHGDHTFTCVAPYVQSCTKCSAKQTWR